MAAIGLDFTEHRLVLPDGTPTETAVVRVKTRVQFLKQDGALSATWAATLDTGAPVSVIPEIFWQSLERDISSEDTSFGGIHRDERCQVPASLAEVRGRLVGRDGAATPLCSFPAYLAHTNEVPLLIGFAGFLSRFDVHLSYRRREAWVEVP